MEKIIVYELSNLDDEARVKIGRVWLFKNLEVAEKVKEDAFKTIDKVELIIFNTYEEFIQEKNNNVKLKALWKLTNEEKRALGLI
jgi:hypothetical protein